MEEFIPVDRVRTVYWEKGAKSNEIKRCLTEKLGAFEDRLYRCSSNDLNLAGTCTLTGKTHYQTLPSDSVFSTDDDVHLMQTQGYQQQRN